MNLRKRALPIIEGRRRRGKESDEKAGLPAVSVESRKLRAGQFETGILLKWSGRNGGYTCLLPNEKPKSNRKGK